MSTPVPYVPPDGQLAPYRETGLDADSMSRCGQRSSAVGGDTFAGIEVEEANGLPLLPGATAQIACVKSGDARAR